MTRLKALPDFTLGPGEVHVWLVGLEGPGDACPAWERSLSPEEVARSKQYRFERDRLRFIARRGILRQLLGRYCGLHPAAITYQTNPYGKMSFPACPFSFNLSSSQDMSAFAFALDTNIGVDIEQVRPQPELAQLAEHWFSPEEREGLPALPADLQTEAFYHIWTQKEAILKARGVGVSVPLNGFSVTVEPRRPASLVSIEAGAGDIHSWKFASRTFEPDWRVAVCLRSEAEPRVVWREADPADLIPGDVSPELPNSV